MFDTHEALPAVRGLISLGAINFTCVKLLLNSKGFNTQDLNLLLEELPNNYPAIPVLKMLKYSNPDVASVLTAMKFDFEYVGFANISFVSQILCTAQPSLLKLENPDLQRIDKLFGLISRFRLTEDLAVWYFALNSELEHSPDTFLLRRKAVLVASYLAQQTSLDEGLARRIVRLNLERGVNLDIVKELLVTMKSSFNLEDVQSLLQFTQNNTTPTSTKRFMQDCIFLSTWTDPQEEVSPQFVATLRQFLLKQNYRVAYDVFKFYDATSKQSQFYRQTCDSVKQYLISYKSMMPFQALLFSFQAFARKQEQGLLELIEKELGDAIKRMSARDINLVYIEASVAGYQLKRLTSLLHVLVKKVPKKFILCIDHILATLVELRMHTTPEGSEICKNLINHYDIDKASMNSKQRMAVVMLSMGMDVTKITENLVSQGKVDNFTLNSLIGLHMIRSNHAMAKFFIRKFYLASESQLGSIYGITRSTLDKLCEVLTGYEVQLFPTLEYQLVPAYMPSTNTVLWPMSDRVLLMDGQTLRMSLKLYLDLLPASVNLLVFPEEVLATNDPEQVLNCSSRYHRPVVSDTTGRE